MIVYERCIICELCVPCIPLPSCFIFMSNVFKGNIIFSNDNY